MNRDRSMIYFTRFLPDPYLDGGCRRCAQISRLFKPLSLEIVSSRSSHLILEPSIPQMVFSKLRRKLNALNILVKYYVTEGEYRLWHHDFRKFAYYQKKQSGQWKNLIDKKSCVKLVIIDDPIYFIPLLKALKKRDILIVAHCHNLESLSPGQVVQEKQRLLFNKELDSLAMCDLVITISREETILLRNLGINAIYHPYYPDELIIKRMLRIREQREYVRKKDVIIVGTVGNSPTRQGMISAINAWKNHKLSQSEDKLLIAGYGTDVIKDFADGINIEFLGELSNEDLDIKLARIKACLCYQERGSGALTKIPEMLIAGIPIIANFHAARSYYNMRGIVELSCLDELEKAVQKTAMIDGSVPVPDSPDSSSLIEEVNKLLYRPR